MGRWGEAVCGVCGGAAGDYFVGDGCGGECVCGGGGDEGTHGVAAAAGDGKRGGFDYVCAAGVFDGGGGEYAGAGGIGDLPDCGGWFSTKATYAEGRRGVCAGGAQGESAGGYGESGPGLQNRYWGDWTVY